ncbi:MAG: GNAT family N-acetyltransferase, partial [Fluviicola sp.]|nr:GNAT family N-acetyltransferase [Fluviicola sp.]
MIKAETQHLILREISASDENDLFELDSNPEVHRYLGNEPVTEIEQIRTVIKNLQQQYLDHGIARWAVIDKLTNECIGWAGLRFHQELNKHQNIYELGYRFKQQHWGKGFATEASHAILQVGFETIKPTCIYAITDPENANSIHVLT